MKPSRDSEMRRLRDEVASLLAKAIRLADDSHAETDRVADATQAETVRVQEVHDEEMDLALATRDLLGQAKGIIMATMLCDADRAFDLIRKQSQAENRRAIEVAAEIAARVSRRAAG